MAMPIAPKVRTALQINMHPLDVGHVVHTLPHQLRAWAGQVDRIVISLDTQVSKTGRYHASDYQQSLERLTALLGDMQRDVPALVVDIVDHSAPALEAVRAAFFASTPEIPAKAFDGGPFHAYFYGLLRANAEYVLHMDSDMLFGGLEQSWIEQAVVSLEARPDALFICPFPGPPCEDGSLNPALHQGFPGLRSVEPPQRLHADHPAYRFRSVSTRIFLLDMQRFAARVGALQLVRPDARRRLRAWLLAQSPLAMPAEEILSSNMERLGLERIDMLGHGTGMYSLHPPYRNPAFYRQLPDLIARIEAGDLPDAQRGDYDINASMIDWSDALAAKRPSMRLRKALRQLVAANLARFSAG